jgi:hypothetical protein
MATTCWRQLVSRSRLSPDSGARSAGGRDRLWPSQCCVPAFLAASIAALAPEEVPEIDDQTRRDLATILGVTLAPEDPNPWDLPTSEDSREWGVSASVASDRFPQVCERLAPALTFSLELRSLNQIPFELYESVVLDYRGLPAILGVSFDHAILQTEMGREEPARRAWHIARLSPIGDEWESRPNALSAEFKFDYSGLLWLFDDSEELVGDEALSRWRALVRASYAIGGGFWIVRREGAGDGR